MNSVDLKSSGNYGCEVSAEAPHFNSAQSLAKMEVIGINNKIINFNWKICIVFQIFIAIPENGPFITDIQIQYRIGSEINFNCTSGKSYPVSQLQWYINDEEIVSTYLISRNSIIKTYLHYKQVQQKDPPLIIKDDDGLEQSVLGLKFVLQERHFLHGSISFKCISTFSPLERIHDDTIKNVLIKDTRQFLLLGKFLHKT